MPGLVVRSVEPSDAGALAALFERENSPCYCRYWHFAGTNKEWELRCAMEPGASRSELLDAVHARSLQASGLIARIEGAGADAILGWLKLTPRASLPKLTARPPYRALDGDAERVLSIGCLLVDPAHRRSGIARALVEGAIAVAPSLGAQAIEAYPRVSPDRMLHDAELWNGAWEMYRGLGFEVVREGRQYPVVRRGV